jgi:hypothetical protein
MWSPSVEKWSQSRRGLKSDELNDRTATHDPLTGAFILPMLSDQPTRLVFAGREKYAEEAVSLS